MKGIPFVLLLALILSLFFSTQVFRQDLQTAKVNDAYVLQDINAEPANNGEGRFSFYAKKKLNGETEWSEKAGH